MFQITILGQKFKSLPCWYSPTIVLTFIIIYNNVTFYSNSCYVRYIFNTRFTNI